ncbi:hypothetical protein METBISCDRAFT_28763 [Metschnikowia bicuspidata]|uniref:Uncharacterized protein n=1 Tax=Metschnikowia bicuspidata TaxID=27322 RepID=A0A4P9Z7X3_9ASCO|nr:hypothetical protein METBISCDRAFT_28763 [Metschnikowia bicuspidata]
MLLVSMPTALIETARHQAIFLSQVQHLIIDDGDALYRGNSDQKAIYEIKFLFTVVPSPYSMQDYAFITIAVFFTCLDLTIRDDLWKRVRASFATITPLEPEPHPVPEPVALFVVPDWTRAKLKSEKMVINYDSHDPKRLHYAISCFGARRSLYFADGM